MQTTNQFLKFAAECELMAKGTRNPQEKAVWRGLAQRWLRCAALLEQQEFRLPPRAAMRKESHVGPLAHSARAR